jgi:hypothetical protein
MDTTRGISGLLEEAVVIVFALLLEEPLNLAMLPFLILFHVFLHTLFFIITSISSTGLLLSGFKPNW